MMEELLTMVSSGEQWLTTASYGVLAGHGNIQSCVGETFSLITVILNDR